MSVVLIAPVFGVYSTPSGSDFDVEVKAYKDGSSTPATTGALAAGTYKVDVKLTVKTGVTIKDIPETTNAVATYVEVAQENAMKATDISYTKTVEGGKEVITITYNVVVA